jgi:hypothetical protein
MTHENIKLLAVNTTIFGLSFTSIENSMRIFLLGLSILYTSIMIIKLLTKKKEDENK